MHFQNQINSKFETLSFNIQFFYKFNLYFVFITRWPGNTQYTKQKGK